MKQRKQRHTKQNKLKTQTFAVTHIRLEGVEHSFLAPNLHPGQCQRCCTRTLAGFCL
jgi:hypothetical protein